MAEPDNDMTASIARWAEENAKILRVWVSPIRGQSASQRSIDVVVELEPVTDSEESITVWLANSEAWQRQLRSRVLPNIDLDWFDPDGSTEPRSGDEGEDKILVYERVS